MKAFCEMCNIHIKAILKNLRNLKSNTSYA